MDDEICCFAGVRYDADIPDDMWEMIILPCVYAVFPDVVEAWKQLYSEWLPASGHELANLPCIEYYLEPWNKVKHELWVPIAKQAFLLISI